MNMFVSSEFSRRSVVGALLGIASGLAFGQSTGTTSIIVPYSAGGSSDSIARISAPYVAKGLGSDVIVENVVGGTGVIAIQRVINSAPNGRLLYLGTAGELIIPPLTNAAIKFKPRDLEAVHPTSISNLVLVVRKSLPVNTVQEFIALAKEKSKTAPLSYGSPGIGSLYHLVGEAMSKTSGAEYNHIPYKGAAPMLQDLMGERIDFTVMAFIRSMPDAVKSGHYKILANMATTKQAELQHLPSISQFPEFKDINFRTGSTLYVSKGTPVEIKEKLNRAIASAMAEPTLVERLEAEGRQVAKPMSLQNSTKYYEDEVAQYEKIVALTGFKVTE